MYIELFLLDNTLMNLLILRLACALCCKPVKRWRVVFTSFAGAVYAALSVSILPFLGSLPLRVILSLLMTFGLPFSSFHDYLKNAAALFIAAFLAGGSTLALSYLLGGMAYNGALMAPLPLRAALLGAAAAFLFVPVVRGWIRSRTLNSNTLKLRLTHGRIQREYTAILDTGNCLADPLTGLSAVILFDPELKPFAVRPIPCSTVGGTMMLKAFIPERMEIYTNAWRSIAVICAVSPRSFKGADALIGQSALPLG